MHCTVTMLPNDVTLEQKRTLHGTAHLSTARHESAHMTAPQTCAWG